MQLISYRSGLDGSVRIPGSKSHTIRAVAFASLAEGNSVIKNPLISLDAKSAARVYSQFGGDIDTTDDSAWNISGFAGAPNAPTETIDVGNSGTTLRMAMGTASLTNSAKVICTGDSQIQSRPSGPLLKSLNDLGAKVKSLRGNDKPPFEIVGKLTGGRTSMEATSSQYLSSLLMNCPFAPGDTEIIITKLNEKPYVDMTLSWLDMLGLKYENRDYRQFFIPGRQKITGFEYEVPGDFSSATFFFCAAALAGKRVSIEGLNLRDEQGDKAVIGFLKQMGADIETIDNTIILRKATLRGLELDLNATPDALPALAVTACFAEGTTRLINVEQARIKETDRIRVMASELNKLGGKVKELPDGLEIQHCKLHGGVVEGYDDHRVVMAMSIAGLMTAEPVKINGAEAAAVTFPDFVDLMNQLGAKME